MASTALASGTLNDLQVNAAQQQLGGAQTSTLAPINSKLEQSPAKAPLDGNASASALQGGKEAVASALPSLDNLTALEILMRREPRNLDHYFAYAQMANKLGEYTLEANTYERMLQLSPTLDRVRLDLGSAYLRLGKFDQAREQLTLVLAKNIVPPQVRANVEKVLANIDSELDEHTLSGILSAGVNWDNNANSAPKSEEVVIQDFVIPLADEQLAQQDAQGFYAFGVSHSYRPRALQSADTMRRWKSSANWYQSKQSSQESLNIKVHSLRTGPEFTLKESGIIFAPAVNYSVIHLADEPYLRSAALEARIDVPAGPQWLLSADTKWEQREFVNSASVSTFELRSGHATQHGLSARYIASEVDIFNLGFTQRDETTEETFFDNVQWGATLGYTRILPHEMFANASLSYKRSVYDDNDALISAKRRHDDELGAGLTLGKQIAEGLSVTLGYQFRLIESNIRNYEYDNHRISASITRQF